MRNLAACLDVILDELAERVAERLAARAPAPATDYVDQHSCGFDARTFARAARAGEFPASKVGRRWIAKRADVDAWLGARRPKKLRLVAPDDASDLRRELGIAKGGRRAS